MKNMRMRLCALIFIMSVSYGWVVNPDNTEFNRWVKGVTQSFEKDQKNSMNGLIKTSRPFRSCPKSSEW